MSKKSSFLKIKEANIEIKANIEEISEISNFINKKETESNSPIIFISLKSSTIDEEEFLNIVEANNKRAGLYQKSLFGRYKEAKKEKDEGYIKDIFDKAILLRDNLTKIEKLKRNKAFMKEWRKNFGRITPESILKHSGEMRKINTIENMSM